MSHSSNRAAGLHLKLSQPVIDEIPNGAVQQSSAGDIHTQTEQSSKEALGVSRRA